MFKANNLSLNIDTTNYISFTNKNKNKTSTNLKLDGKTIKQTHSKSFLCVIID